MSCETLAFTAMFAQVSPPSGTDSVAAWVQGGAVGVLILVLGWIAKILLPGKDAAINAKDVAQKALLDSKDAQLAKKDEVLLAVIQAKSAERERADDKFLAALNSVGDRFQAALLRVEQDHDKRDSAWDVRLEKLVEGIKLDGKESRDHLMREREAEAELRRVERTQREQEQKELRETIVRLTEAVSKRGAIA